MDKNQKIAVGVIVVIALIAAWQLGKKPVAEDTQNQNQTQTPNENINNANNVPTPTPTPSSTSGNLWEGTLLASDNINKGNYRLQTKDHIIYLRTGRDFSSMVGKEVKVSYEGTLDSFVLGDIDIVQK